jgi:hypothetical protein
MASDPDLTNYYFIYCVTVSVIIVTNQLLNQQVHTINYKQQCLVHVQLQRNFKSAPVRALLQKVRQRFQFVLVFSNANVRASASVQHVLMERMSAVLVFLLLLVNVKLALVLTVTWQRSVHVQMKAQSHQLVVLADCFA